MPTIQELKRDHPGEWLAIEVTHEGPQGPEKGELLGHAHLPEEALRGAKDRRRTARGRVYLTFAGPILPEGYAAAF